MNIKLFCHYNYLGKGIHGFTRDVCFSFLFEKLCFSILRNQRDKSLYRLDESPFHLTVPFSVCLYFYVCILCVMCYMCVTCYVCYVCVVICVSILGSFGVHRGHFGVISVVLGIFLFFFFFFLAFSGIRDLGDLGTWDLGLGTFLHFIYQL